jgi:hypothetical protein
MQTFNVGDRIGRLIVLERLYGKDKNKALCKCDCGTTKKIYNSGLYRRTTKSCGCYKLEINHKQCSTITYNSWKAMKIRCLVETNHNFSHYGGRGIKICEAWLKSFPQFLSDLGPRPSKLHTIERINNDGNYEPGNCKWALSSEQNQNKTTTKWLTFRGETKTVVAWAEILNISRYLIYSRLSRGWTVEDILTVPIIKGRTGISRGNHRANRNLTFKGETKSISEWAKTLGMQMKTLHRRVYTGWSVKRALTQPVRIRVAEIAKCAHTNLEETQLDLGELQPN